MPHISEDRNSNKTVLENSMLYFERRVLPVLHDEFSTHHNNIDLLLHSIRSGKRLRPFYCMSSYHLAGGKENKQIDYAAAAMELIHCSSLLIDDELDAREIRPDRKVQSVRNRFSPQESVFMGACLELLYTYSMLLKACRGLAHERKEQIMNTFAQTYSEGVTKEVEKWKHIEDRLVISKEEYWTKHIHSSGGLFFRMSGRIGAMLATDDKTTIEKLSDMGYAFGQILQAGDDIKDLKPDMRQGYYSLAVIDYVDSLDGNSVEKQETIECLSKGLSGKDVEELYGKMAKTGAIQRTLDDISQRGALIKQIALDFQENEHKKNVETLVDFLSTRMKLM